MRRGVATLCVLAGLLAAAPVATAGTLKAHGGNVSATLTFNGGPPSNSGERLTIARAGKVVYDRPVSSSFCDSSCGVNEGALRVLDLNHNGQRQVTLDLFTGGAHCCAILQIFSWDPAAHTYVKTQRNFGDPGVRFVHLAHNRRFQLLTADDSFAYEFTSFAFSGLPIEILTFSHRHFTNVTRRFPKAVARDAALWLKEYKSVGSRNRITTGFIAAWAADEDLLGNSGTVSQYLSQQAAAGHLNSGGPEPSGKSFVTKLQKFLRAHGYLR